MASRVRDMFPFGDVDAEMVHRAAHRFEVVSVESVIAGLALGGAVVGLLDTLLSRLAELGLSPARWRVLVALMFQSGEAGATMGELAAHLEVKEPTVTATVDRLEEEGLALRTRDPADRRKVRVVITADGRDLVARVIPRISAVSAALVDSMGGAVPVKEMANLISGAVASVGRVEL